MYIDMSADVAVAVEGAAGESVVGLDEEAAGVRCAGGSDGGGFQCQCRVSSLQFRDGIVDHIKSSLPDWYHPDHFGWLNYVSCFWINHWGYIVWVLLGYQFFV